MSDNAAVALAGAVAVGAWAAWPVPLGVALGAVAIAVVLRWPAMLIIAALLVAASLSHRSWAGLTPPEPGERLAGMATLVTDPEWSRFGQLQVEMRAGSRRVAAGARGLAASRLVTRMAGERVEVEGRLRPLTGRAAPYFRRRHIAARLDVTSVGELPHAGTPVDRIANHVRGLLDKGSDSMHPNHQALFAGFLLGDDRGQPPATVFDFRASGLSHLLAVSGQNVAFVLAIAAPLLRRLRLRGRLVAGAGVLVIFGVLTRWEPTVLRAVAMASLALIATTLGRPASSLRLLALAVAALLLIDPLLVGSIAFQLSVAASAGIVLIAPGLRERLPGPRVVAEPVAVTVAAQAAVAPILVVAFDGVPVSSLPANLLAGPAAAPITVWGLTAGVAAGLLGEPMAGWLHVPTELLVGWVAHVATWAAAMPLGDVGPREVLMLVVAGSAALLWRRRRRAVLVVAGVVVAVSAIAPVVGGPAPAAGTEVAPGARLWHTSDAVVVVVDRPDPVAVLTGLRRAHVRRIDALVTTSESPSATETVTAITRRIRTRAVVHAPDRT